MSRGFAPLTIGFDWEIWLLGLDGMPVGDDVSTALAARISRRVPDCPTGLDWRQLEIRSGPCGNFEELRERIDVLVAEVRSVAAARKLLVYLAASHPLHPNYCGGHVHAGTFGDIELAGRIQVEAIRHVPALIALASNSPFTNGRSGEYASYRIAECALRCCAPLQAGDPELTGVFEGLGDVCLKNARSTTLEVRVPDAPSHPGLYAEIATVCGALIAGLADRLGRRRPRRLRPAEWHAYHTDRLAATRHGLRATFDRGGEPISAVDAVREVLEIASERMTAFGLAPDRLEWIPKLLRKRVSQADFVLALRDAAADPWSLITDVVAATEESSGFERWLEATPTRRAARPIDPTDDLLRGLGPYGRVLDLNRWANLTGVDLQRRIDALVAEGVLEPDHAGPGLRFRRVSGSAER